MPKEALQTLTPSMYYVLLSLYQPRCGIEIMERISELTCGRTVIGPGTLYTMLAKFEENGMIVPSDAPGVGKRKNYVITAYGKRMLKEEYERLSQLVADGKTIMEEEKNEQ